jgi:hypothetical protein
VIVSGQFPPSLDSLTKATTGFKVQLSASSITMVGSGAGAGPAGIVVVVGLLAVGGVVSSTVIVQDMYFHHLHRQRVELSALLYSYPPHLKQPLHLEREHQLNIEQQLVLGY